MPQKMRLNTSPKSVSFGLRTLSAAVVSALLFASTANAAGLGKLTVNSALGQPLRAEIELTSVSNDENGLLVPRLASSDAYRSAGIDLSPVLYSLRFAVAKHDDGRQYISVTSAQPVNEPFVDMLIELGGNGAGKLLREYTFLLDPADLSTGQAPQVVGARPVPSRSPSTVTPLPAPDNAAPLTERPSSRSAKQPSERPTKVAASKPTEPAPSSGTGESQYQVKSGDSLSKIAGQFKPEGASLDQMLVALYRNNQGAFGGNNMNRLRAGQVLTIPDPASVTSISSGEAHGVIIAQAADFNEYRSKLAGQVANSEAQKSGESKQSGSGKITAKVEEKASPTATAQDKLKLSKAGGAPDKGSKIAAGEEDRIAKEKELAEANARVKQLEKNVTDLKSLLDVKSKNVAEQAKPAPKADVKPVAPAPAPVPVAAAPAPAPTPVPAPAPAVAAASAAASAPAPKPDAAPVKAEVKPDEVASVSPPPKPPKPKAKVVPPPEPSLLDELFGNPLVIGGAALLLVAGGAFGVYRGYRKRKEKSFGDSIITDSSLKANSLFGSTGGQSVDTNNSVFNSNFAPSASQLDSNEVDPVAEADVYIAYGRDAQAEEILKEALRTQPDRNAVRVKLLEIYANRKDVRSFETVASELYGLTKGEGEDWQQAASLGLSIDPKNPLYAAGKGGATQADLAKTMALPSSHALDAAALDDLVPNTHDDMPHLGGSTLGQGEPDTVARHPESKLQKHEDLPLDVSTSLDFDLDGIGDEPADSADTVSHDLSHDLTHELKVPEPATKHEAPAAADFSNIDFDFMNDEPAAKAPAAAPSFHHDDGLSAATTVARQEAHEFTKAELPSVPVIAPEEVPSHASAKAAEPHSMDFDLSGITLELDSHDKKAAADHGQHADAGHLPDLQMPDIPMHETKAPVAELHVPEFHIPDIPAAKVAESPALHIGEIPGLDLHAAEHHAADHLSIPDIHMPAAANMAAEAVAETVHHHLEAPVELDTGVDHEYSNNAEMATKLDLAVAYQEIGDKEGARELLDEVIKGGIPEFAEKAKGLLAKMS